LKGDGRVQQTLQSEEPREQKVVKKRSDSEGGKETEERKETKQV
jgi:hypothetical protein